jgi:hypothetical protein
VVCGAADPRHKRRARAQRERGKLPSASGSGVDQEESAAKGEETQAQEVEGMGERELDAPSPECVICLDKRPIFAVAECGHLCMCAGCCERIMAGQATCPVCNVAIVQQPMRIFRS